MRRATMRIILTSLVVATFLQGSTAFAATTINANSCSQPDVQAAVDAATDGTQVNIPAGNCVWATHVGWSNKNIYVKGAGIGNTVISRDGDYIFYIGGNTSGKGAWRLSDMTFTGATTAAVVLFTSEGNPGFVSGWRLDHIHFDYPAGQRTGFMVRGTSYGVADHNVFDWHAGVAVFPVGFNASDSCSATNPEGNFLDSQPLDLGTANAIYFEDNTFNSHGFPLAAYDTSAGGGRTVFRHNTVTGGYYYSHWTRGCEFAGQLHEIYNNTFIGNADYNAYPIRLESGTGVIFNNSVQSFNIPDPPFIMFDDRRAVGGGETSVPLNGCDGAQPWDGNFGDLAAPGWPCLGQIGRSPGKSVAQIMAGDKQVSAPIYVWNNGVEAGCANGGTCVDVLGVWATPAAYVKATPHPNGDVDYVNAKTPRPGYTPFVYPHPLVSSASAAPSTPNNLRVVPGP